MGKHNRTTTKNGVRTPTGVNTTKLDKRQRRQIRFMLDAANPIDREIGQALIDRKKTRDMTPTIRKSLRLFLALEAGDLSVLFELFPQLAEQFTPKASEVFEAIVQRQATPPSAEFEKLLNELAELRKEIAAMRATAPPSADSPPRPHAPQADTAEAAGLKIGGGKKASAETVAANFTKAAASYGFFD